MSSLAITAIVTASLFAYSAIGGVMWQLFDHRDHYVGRELFAALWPIALPALLGARLVSYRRRPRTSLPTATARTKESST